MAFARNWRHAWVSETPERVSVREIPSLNAVFSEAFTERYRKDGMVGVRVPHLNPAVWKFAITDAEEGAMIWRNARDGIAAFNMVHRSGVEGWMGPLAVHPDCQGQGIGKMIVSSGVEWLKQKGARVIGLETMPRTMDNVGFYSTLGFTPGYLTVTVTLEAARAGITSTTMSSLNPHERELALRQCRALLEQLSPGYDYTREIVLTALDHGRAADCDGGLDATIRFLAEGAQRVVGRDGTRGGDVRVRKRDAHCGRAVCGVCRRR